VGGPISSIDLIIATLTSPMVLAFALGAVATVAGSDLRLPAAAATVLSYYLLFAIGLKGGVSLATASPGDLVLPVGATLALGVVTPVVAFAAARRILPIERIDAGALAAHYGSVSAVTFASAVTLLDGAGVTVEGFAPALLAMLEVPGIIVALVLAAGIASRGSSALGAAVREAVLGKSIMLLIGGLVIGLIAGPEGTAAVDPLFRDLFFGALTIFLLDLGVAAAQRCRDLVGIGPRLLLFALAVPLVNGALGVLLGTAAGLSVGGATVLGVMAASASYIAAPAAVRVALPEANPAIYLTASLGITFPVNLVLGIPFFHILADTIAA
jgi:uncharacterized protein